MYQIFIAHCKWHTDWEDRSCVREELSDIVCEKNQVKLTEKDRTLDLTEYTWPQCPHLTHGKCAKIVVTKIWKYLPDWNQDFFPRNKKPDTEGKQENS